jgi:hypothetical protein
MLTNNSATKHHDDPKLSLNTATVLLKRTVRFQTIILKFSLEINDELSDGILWFFTLSAPNELVDFC